MTFAPRTAFVPAAGLGTRMRHLTTERPKPLIEVAGRYLINHALDRIAAAGIPDAIVNVHYKAHQIEAALQSRLTPTITISDERAGLLDTGGGISKALPLLGAEPFLIHNSDSIWLEDSQPGAIPNLAEAWDGAAMDCLMLLAQTATSVGYDGPGDFTIDINNRLTRHGTTQHNMTASATSYVFTGVSIAHPRLFADAPNGAYSLNLLWDRAIGKGRLFGAVLKGRWMHVGTPEAVAKADQLLATATMR